MAEVGAAHGAGARPVGAGRARDVSVVALEDFPASRHGEADGTLQDLLHLCPQVSLPRLSFLHPALHGVKGVL